MSGSVLIPEPLADKPIPKEELLKFGDCVKTVKITGDAEKLAQEFVKEFDNAIRSGNVDQIVSLFADATIWRDMLALQWEFRSLENEKIKPFLQEHLSKSGLKNVQVNYECNPTIAPPFEGLEWLQVFIKFETAVGKGKGVLRLVQQEEGGRLRLFTAMTMLDEIKGHEETMGQNRPKGVDHGQHEQRTSYPDRREWETSYKDHSPQVVIVGGGQAGLTVAARLKMMGVDTLIVEKNKHIGDNWRNRYKFLVLHDPVWYDHLPYINFPPTWPVYTPKDKLGDFFEFYVKALDLNAWTESVVTGGEYDEKTKKWTVRIDKNGKQVELNPNHIVQATGHSGEPNIPTFPGQEKFKGKIVHSSQHGSGAEWKDKNALVIGCCNSALDICHDFVEQGAASTTVHQRSSTCVISADGGNKINNKGTYEEGGMPVETLDLMDHSLPNKIKYAVCRNIAGRIADYDEKILKDLKSIGFNLDYGYGGTGHWFKYMIRGGGYYLDVGAAQLLVDGDIKLKQGGEVCDFTEDSVIFSDGTEVKADIVVLATGYQNMRSTARKLFGDKVAEKLGKVWGLNNEMELNHMWTSSGHPGYWYMGGNLALCRFYSKRLALRIVGEEENLVN